MGRNSPAFPDGYQTHARHRRDSERPPKKRGFRMPQEVRRHLPHIDAGRIGMAPRPLLGDLWPWYAWILDVSRKPPTLTMEKMSAEPTYYRIYSNYSRWSVLACLILRGGDDFQC